ncbi:TlpA disulfide reductase family protein [Halostagnicola sp. A-GB9-2]|uniref:TlpA family protein disulfide reductase n=1 Tax=Halostagnicola sp. A-GB9-2 TaxID=3048066 RepID=UPI0024C0773D|nr:TlpA disulfide reductase family protein [Halostagnicola sp. A-GB9-2]MDJ1432878.1 TlpA disulfide reductase family protein [Halostagnicola sp. A-GB9-2]
MNRRDVLAGLGSVGVLGTSAVVYSRFQADGDVDPVTVETLEAPGSEAGETTVPEAGRVTFLEVFATWCSTCRGMMSTLQEVHERTDDVHFLSVSNEPLGATVDRTDVVEWWRAHDGSWTVGVDADLVLTSELDVRAVPATFVFDEQNRIVNADTGTKSADTLLEWIESARV